MFALGSMEGKGKMFRLSVRYHKTAKKYGPSVLIVNKLCADLLMMLRGWNSIKVDEVDNNVKPLSMGMAILTQTGLPLTSASVNR